jgi:superfamily II DNA or RNA helicase
VDKPCDKDNKCGRLGVLMQLFQHQKEIIADDKKKCGLFLGTGSAKTATALHLARGNILVITPKLQKEEENFIREANKWSLEKKITSLSKEQFKKVADTLPYFDTVIIDEAHTVAGVTPNIQWIKKQPHPKSSELFKSVMRYLDKHKPERLYLLTATPIRSPMTVYAFAKMLGLNWNFYEFRDTFYICVKKGFREFFIAKSDEQTKKRLGLAVQKLGYTGRLSDYFDVPEQIYKTMYVEPTVEQKKRLKEIALDFPDPLVQIGKRHQIENGVLKGDQFAQSEEIKDNKIDVLLDLAIEFPKLIIFARYTQQLHKIKDALSNYNCVILDGQTKDRAEVIRRAEESDACVIIIQAQISAGFELPSFPTMVFASMDYSIVNRTQAEGRILRANALKHNLYIDLVVKGGVDEAVYKSIQNKQDFSEKIYAEKGSII